MSEVSEKSIDDVAILCLVHFSNSENFVLNIGRIYQKIKDIERDD
jgi:hypothetical protein